MWAYAEEDTGMAFVGVDLTPAALINNSNDPNAESPEGSPVDVAIRDIKAGEEIVMRYSNFEKPGLWKEMGIVASRDEDPRPGWYVDV